MCGPTLQYEYRLNEWPILAFPPNNTQHYKKKWGRFQIWFHCEVPNTTNESQHTKGPPSPNEIQARSPHN